MNNPFSRRAGRGARPFSFLFALCLIALTSACAQTQSAGPEVSIKRPAGKLNVLLMPADVRISLLTTGGLTEPNAEWSEQGRQNVVAALKAEMAERNIEVIPYADDSVPSYQIASEHEQLLKLHQAVGASILLHKYGPGLQLPTKKDKFDWTLGQGVQSLRDSQGGNYALFVYAEDSFSSGGRVALQVAAIVLFGAHVPGGRQIAFASLVDLDSGSVVWFNVLTSGGGDLREPESAREAVDTLLANSPL